MNDCPMVSVIIPTYNRAKMLGATIESFLNQSYPKDRYEMLIADNNSSDDTKAVVNDWQAISPVTIRYVFESRQGVHYARNSAAKIAKGDVLYFTDDDMLADKDLLKNLLPVFAMGYNVASATGRVLPLWEADPPKWVLRHCCNGLLSINDRSEQMVIAPFNVGVYSCHQAILRDVFFRSGGFNPENTAGEWIGDGETGLNIKIKELGYSFAFIGDSVIRHMIPVSRMTQQYLNRRLANQGNCDSYTAYRQHKFSAVSLWKKILGHCVSMMMHMMQSGLKLVLFDDGWRLHRAYINYRMNRIKYDYRLSRDSHWRKIVLRNDWLQEND